MGAALFVTGTDTGVGKTVVACALILALRQRGVAVGAMKPAETGCPPEGWPPDGAALAAAAGLDLPRPAVVPYALPEPLAPAVAARRAGVRIDLQVLDQALAAQQAARQLVVVEGAGGLAVPLTDELDMAGLAARWGLPLLVVARPGLGTLNHTVLTVAYARQRGLRVLGVVLNPWPEEPDTATATNPAELVRLTGVPILGRLPRLPGVDIEAGRLDGLAAAAAQHLDLGPVLDLLAG